MKRIVSIIVAAILGLALLADDRTVHEKYIDKYAPIAVEEMYRSGIPASITLAQGMLESRCGLSELASEGKNHFGIKCHSDWKGKSMKVDDDSKGECFRVYSDVVDSYRDHSDFLRYRDRYKFLFDYELSDYEAWANGLKKAGYATDPQYPAKLIKLIEDYNLSRFDVMPSVNTDNTFSQSDDSPKEELKPDVPSDEQVAEKSKKKQRKPRKPKTRPEVESQIPESPNVLEEAEPVTQNAAEVFRFSLSRPVYTQNGVPFIYSEEGESYASIAESNDLFLKEILFYNDIEFDRSLKPGTVVYLRMKKQQTRKGLDKYVVDHDGESLHEICQRFAVTEKSVMKMNKFAEGHILREGDTVKLRK